MGKERDDSIALQYGKQVALCPPSTQPPINHKIRQLGQLGNSLVTEILFKPWINSGLSWVAKGRSWLLLLGNFFFLFITFAFCCQLSTGRVFVWIWVPKDGRKTKQYFYSSLSFLLVLVAWSASFPALVAQDWFTFSDCLRGKLMRLPRHWTFAYPQMLIR